MKKNLTLVAAATIILLAIITFSLTEGNNRPIPTETIILDTEEDSEGQSKREVWIESMHRAAPGDNWRTLEYQNQRTRSERRLKAGQNLANMRGSGMSDTIVAGLFSGMWQEKGSRNQAGSVFDTEYDAETDEIWLISAGGTLWKGKRDGSLWEVINQDYRFSTGTLKFIPTETGRRLIATIANVPHYSDDDGLSWTASTGFNIIDEYARVKHAQFMDDEQRSIYLLFKPDYWTHWRIYRSEDKGETYTQISAYDGFNDGGNNVALDKLSNTEELYILENIIGDNTIRLSRVNQADGSSELLSESDNFQSSDRVAFVGTATETDTIFYSYSILNVIYKTTDFGETWTEQGTMPDTPWEVGIYLSPSNPDVLYTGGLNCFRSLDGGQSWDLVNEWYEYYDNVQSKLHADMMDFHEFTAADGEIFTLISNHGGLNISYDNLNTVDNIGTEGLNVSQYYSVKSGAADANYIIAGSQDQGLQRGLDDGAGEAIDFDQVISGDYGHITFTNNGNSFWTVYPDGWITYYGNTYAGGYTNDYDVANNSSIWIPPLKSTLIPGENSIYVAGGNIDFAGGSHIIKLEKESDGEIIDTELEYNFTDFSDSELSAIAVSPFNPDHIYTATSNGRFFYSIDGGLNFEQNVNFLSGGHYLYGQSIYASQIDSNTVYLAGSGYSGPAVYKSINGGEFFTDFSEGLPPTLVFEITANATETLLFAATEDGPYVYVVEEEKWFDMSGMCAPSQTYWSVQYVEDFNLVRFGTYGRGIWDFVIEDEPLISDVNDIISDTDLFKVYPTPAQSYLTVEMSKHITVLNLTDISGRKVKSFQLSEQKTSLDVSDLARGVYILNGEYEGQVFGRKIILE